MFIKNENFERARRKRDIEPWKTYWRELSVLCGKLLVCGVPDDLMTPNKGLFRIRFVSRAVISLCGYYRLTNEEKYAGKALDFLTQALNWDIWHKKGAEDWDYNLGTGEISLALAFFLNFTREWLPGDKKAYLVEIIENKLFASYLKAAADPDPAKRAWWYENKYNWNAVTNGGTLCLALELENESAAAAKIVPVAMRGINKFVELLHEDGSCGEGTGYWLYGSIFLAYAVRWYEAAKNVSHPLFEKNFVNDGMYFVFDFSPKGAALSFGDNDRFNPLGGIYAITERTGRKDMANLLTRRIMDKIDLQGEPPVFLAETVYMRAHEIFALLCCDAGYDPDAPDPCENRPFAVYPDNGWGIFRKDGIAVAFRSGRSNINHAMRDLNAVQLAKDGVRILSQMGAGAYPNGWYEKTRLQFFEDSTLSKCGMLIDGLGQLNYGEAEWGTDDGLMWSDAADMHAGYVKKMKRTVRIVGGGIEIRDEFEIDDTLPVAWPETRYITEGNFINRGENIWTAELSGVSVKLSVSSDAELISLVCDAPGSIAVQPVFRLLRLSPAKPVKKCTITTLIAN